VQNAARQWTRRRVYPPLLKKQADPLIIATNIHPTYVGIPCLRLASNPIACLFTINTMSSNAAAALARVDAGSLSDIFEDRPGRVQQPVMQCVQIKPIAAQPGGQERHRVIFSDTKNYIQTMLAVQQNHLVEQHILRRGVLVQLIGYSANKVKTKR
jgi:hypothetical protein